jgi:hypothetical protein
MNHIYPSLRIRIVAPGAEILVDAIEPSSPGLTVANMTTEQWIQLADAFHDWVFKPDVLQDESYIRDDVVEDQQQASIHLPSEISKTSERSLLMALAKEGRLEDEDDNLGEEDEDEIYIIARYPVISET